MSVSQGAGHIEYDDGEEVVRREEKTVEGQVMKGHYLTKCRSFFLKVIEFIKNFKIENALICTLILEKHRAG